MNVQDIIIYRNCFTGDTSGGDMHMTGLVSWIIGNTACAVHYVRPIDDGQEKAYADIANVDTFGYVDTKYKKSIALMYLIRTLKTIKNVKLPALSARTTLVASSHFLPDVVPAYFAGNKSTDRYVFIHHIIRDMPRQKGFNSLMANFQESITFWFIKRRFKGIIVVNDAVAARLRELGFKQNILVSSNFVADQQERPLPAQRRKHALIFCGRLVKQKGVYDFIKICEAIQPNFADSFDAVMIGAGPEREELQKIINDKKLAIKLTGFVEDAEKIKLLKESKLFVFPSVEEGWGIAVAEALSTGTPVVAYELPVYAAIFENAIHTVPLRDVVELTKITETKLKDSVKNPPQYEQEAQEIYDFAKQFTLEKVAKKEFDFLVGVKHG